MKIFKAAIATLIILFAFHSALMAEDISVMDSNGRVVTVPLEPQRIVAITLDSVEVIRLMGAVDRIVGTIDYIKKRQNMVPEAAYMTSVGGRGTFDYEALVRLKPDLVISYAFKPGPDFESRLNSLNLRLLRLDLYVYETFIEEVLVMARILGGDAPERAEKFISWLEARLEKVREIVGNANGERPTFLVEHWVERRIFGPGSGVYTVASLTGARNLGEIFDKTSVTVDEEWVIKQNPDVYIKAVTLPENVSLSEKKEIMEQTRLSILERKGWEGMKAVKSGRVHVMDGDDANGTRLLVGLYQLCHWLYPELVPENASEEVNREYWTMFQGMEPE